jgi:hypothetical protein
VTQSGHKRVAFAFEPFCDLLPELNVRFTTAASNRREWSIR